MGMNSMISKLTAHVPTKWVLYLVGPLMIPAVFLWGLFNGMPWAVGVFLCVGLVGTAILLGRDLTVEPEPQSDLVRRYLEWLPLAYPGIAWPLASYFALDALRDGFDGWVVFGWMWVGIIGWTHLHEAIHSRVILVRKLGWKLAAVTGYPSLMAEHLLHHEKTGLVRDAGTPVRDESLYTFLWRRIPEAIRVGFTAEWRRIKRFDLPWHHDRTMNGCLIVLAMSGAIWFVFGFAAFAGYALQAALVFVMAQGIGYVQHYGLVKLPSRPTGAHLSWNFGCWLGGWLILNFHRHSHHHIEHVDYWQRRNLRGEPALPAGYMPMFMLAAFWPPGYCKVMNQLIDRLDKDYGNVDTPGSCAILVDMLTSRSQAASTPSASID